MIRKLAIIQNGVVTNSIMWDDAEEFVATDECVVVFDDYAGPGWLYDGANFIAPEPEPIEETI